MKKCDNCNGTGKSEGGATPYDDDVTCPECAGTGQVLDSYAECVKQQIDFLHEQDGSPDPEEWDVTDPDLAHDLRTFYDNNVSVDAAASDLFQRGF